MLDGGCWVLGVGREVDGRRPVEREGVLLTMLAEGVPVGGFHALPEVGRAQA